MLIILRHSKGICTILGALHDFVLGEDVLGRYAGGMSRKSLQILLIPCTTLDTGKRHDCS